jgi:hypothetical protein
VFFVDQSGYRTVLSRLGLNSRVDYVDEPLSKRGFIRSKCGSIVFITRGLAVDRAFVVSLFSSSTTTTFNDRTSRSMVERPQRELIRQ